MISGKPYSDRGMGGWRGGVGVGSSFKQVCPPGIHSSEENEEIRICIRLK